MDHRSPHIANRSPGISPVSSHNIDPIDDPTGLEPDIDDDHPLVHEKPRKLCNAEMVALVCAWYVTGSVLNNVLKSFIAVFRFPIFLSFANQLPALVTVVFHLSPLGSGKTDTAVMCCTTVHWRWMMFLGFCSTGAQVLHRYSLLSLHASLVQTIKGCGPFFTAMVSFIWIRERLSIATYLSLVPVVAGVILSCFSEADVNLLGAVAAGLSACCLACGAVGTKKMLKENPAMDDYHTWVLMAQGTGIMLLPLIIMELPQLLAQEVMSWGTALQYIFFVSMLTSVQTRISMKILSLVSPVTHSVISCVKRLVVIACAMVYFGNHPTWQNVLGITSAAVGTLLYQRNKKKCSSGSSFRLDQAANKGLPDDDLQLEHERLLHISHISRLDHGKPDGTLETPSNWGGDCDAVRQYVVRDR